MDDRPIQQSAMVFHGVLYWAHSCLFYTLLTLEKRIHSLDLLVDLYADDAKYCSGKVCVLVILKQETLQSVYQVALCMV